MLSDAKARAAKPKQVDSKSKPNKITDSQGLYLYVAASGTKSWRYDYRFQGRRQTYTYGTYPEYSILEARTAHLEVRKQIAHGIDPMAAKKAEKGSQADAAENSFARVAREWFEVRMVTRSKSHQDRTTRAIEKDLAPYLGKRPIAEITASELLGVLKKIEARGAIETAHRAKQTLGQIFRYAIATSRADRDPSADLKGALKTPQETHFSAITTPAEVGDLMRAIADYRGTPVVKAALQLSPLLFCRPGELRQLEWADINWPEARIEIPAERMKLREPHIIPLSNQALAILEELEPLTGQFRYVFPSARGASRPLSENGVRTALRTMGYDNSTMTPHGFRAMARTLLDEVLGYRIEWVEAQLAHAVKDANGRAYNRTKYLAQRAEMMQAWADYLEGLC
ncbi:integrase arm-type DNA-binding domain-containing protein [Simiduia curdlanivorans]|uniref:Tyrosine-type recombinase/integrase n=1 Tax=Simiduia curdlanivorans TaxID=1492769 RepID=A0ABV8V686_9GAMM|nr:integrase arm-type DNA-binding domain-containing protein [Simiduia curdlanivorans]MDN3638743.1 integrase arm-type DNA-binding domain-containing protein [Simiduia curdlanivorans]